MNNLKKNELNCNIKEDNELQINIMEKAGIPKKEIPKYALSSVADGRILRDYINEVKNGEISIEEAIKKVKQDYEKMKSGEKEGKFVTPSTTEQNESRERSETNLSKRTSSFFIPLIDWFFALNGYVWSWAKKQRILQTVNRVEATYPNWSEVPTNNLN